MATTLACSLNAKKDKELIKFIEDMNNEGYNNSVLLKVALYNFMKTTKLQNKALEDSINTSSVVTEQVTTQATTVEHPNSTDLVVNEKEEIIIQEPIVTETEVTKKIEVVNNINNVNDINTGLPQNLLNKFMTNINLDTEDM